MRSIRTKMEAGWRQEVERLVAEVLARAVTTPLEVASILMQALPLASSSSSSLAPLGLKSYHWTGVLLSCTRLVSHTAIKVDHLPQALFHPLP
jgi:hypothetical protein